MGWAKYQIPDCASPFVLLVPEDYFKGPHAGRDVITANSLEEARLMFKSAVEYYFKQTLEEFAQGCADDFNGDSPENNYTGAELATDPNWVTETFRGHGFLIAKMITPGVYVNDESMKLIG